MDRTEINARLDFKREALRALRKAYLALINGRVKSYQIDNRNLTRFDLSDLKKEIGELEDEIEELENLLVGKRPRKAFGIVPRDW